MKDITPQDSVVPIYLVPPTEEEQAELERLAEAERLATQLQEQKELARVSAIQKLANLGLTEEEAKAVIGL